MPRAGTYEYLFALQAATETEDSYGEKDKTWANSGTTFWGSRLPLAGSETHDQEADVMRTEQRYEIRTHYSASLVSALAATKRVVTSGVAYDIETFVDPDGRRRELKITAVVRG